MSASLFVRGLRRYGLSNPPEAVTRLLDGRHHLERFAMEQAKPAMAESRFVVTG
jgi:hypothetical protein